jgi:CspA family cold shock protein
MQGIVKWFDRNRGFGFIESEGKDYFFHISMLEANSKINKGDKVSFEAKESSRGIRAVKVRKISERSKK